MSDTATLPPYVVTGQRAKQMRVVPADVLKRLYAKSDAKGFAQTAAHLALLVLGGWAILATRGTWWVVPALIVQAIFVNTLFGAMHESTHYSSFRTRRLADILAFFSGAAILNNAGFYRHYHMAHHRYTQDPLRDPELITSGTPKTLGNYLFRISSIPFVMIRVRDIFLFPFGFRGDVTYIHESAWPEVRRWGRLLLAFYALLIVGSILLKTDAVLWVWFIPLLIGLPLLRLYLLTEHTLCPNSDDGFANTRTTISNPLVRFLMWNLPYHAEHHLLPNISFWNLPEAHKHLGPHLKFISPSYTATHREILRSLA